MRSRVALALMCLLLAGCLISEQEGQLIPSGDLRFWDGKMGEVVFHFDSTFNKALILGRTLLLAAVGAWFFKVSRTVGIVLGVPLFVLAGYLAVKDAPAVARYRIAMLESGLTLRIPPDPELQVGWKEIEAMRITGLSWQEGPAVPGARSRADTSYWTTLPDWKEMELRLTGGRVVTVDLERLSIEQRQSAFRAIATRAGMVRVK